MKWTVFESIDKLLNCIFERNVIRSGVGTEQGQRLRPINDQKCLSDELAHHRFARSNVGNYKGTGRRRPDAVTFSGRPQSRSLPGPRAAEHAQSFGELDPRLWIACVYQSIADSLCGLAPVAVGQPSQYGKAIPPLSHALF